MRRRAVTLGIVRKHLDRSASTVVIDARPDEPRLPFPAQIPHLIHRTAGAQRRLQENLALAHGFASPPVAAGKAGGLTTSASTTAPTAFGP